ncbi:unnamed protein product, partial [Ectocarpus fasciculatus]
LARGTAKLATRSLNCAVNSHNEFDPLEEVIVGRVEGSTIPEWHVSGKAVWPEKYWDMYKTKAGQPFPPEILNAAAKELDYFAKVLEAEGVTVRRPEVGKGDFAQSYKTPDFECSNGLYAAMPRDVLMVVGNEIIEAPMAWRSRYFEYRPYRKLIKEYFHKGGKWTTAPKPQMSDELYASEDTFKPSTANEFVVTEFEPVFDAAEFTRIGKDLFVQRSQVTNEFGIEWMRRHLGDKYRIHVLDFQDKNAMHIDGTFIPLCPGKLLINPKRNCIVGEKQMSYTFEGVTKDYKLPAMFKGWDIFVAEQPMLSADHPLFFTSPWTATCNIIMLDHKRVICEAHETKMIQNFKDWGFTPIPVPFRNFMPLGGSFHCATVDIRRRGELQDYFN